MGLSLNVLVLGYGRFVQPLVSLPPHMPKSGTLACAIVTGVNPLEGVIRFLLLSVLLIGLGMFATSRPSRPLFDEWRASRWAVMVLLGLVAVTLSRLPNELNVCFGLGVAGLFLGAAVLPDRTRAWIATRVEYWMPVAFAAMATAVAMGGWLRVLGVANPVWWACGLSLLAVTSLVGACERSVRLESQRQDRWVAARLPAVFAILGALTPFTLWPMRPALAWIAIFGVVFFVRLHRACRERGARDVPGVVSAFVIPLAIVAICGKYALAETALDDHHEAEQAIPGLLLLQGQTPLVHFQFIHSLLVDCLSSALAFSIWDVSIHALRMFREFVCAPLRAVLVWLVLTQIFRRQTAAFFWLLLAAAGLFLVPHPREVLWVEPVLVVLAFFLHAERTGARWSAPVAAFLAPVAAALSPEVGLPVAVGIFFVLVIRAWRKRARGDVVAILLAFVISGGMVIVVLAGFGMLLPFVRFMLTRASVMTELNARWMPQSALHPFLLVRAFALAIMVVAWVRRGPLTAAGARLLPFILVNLLATFGVMSDEPLRQWRFVGLDVIGLAVALRSDGRRYSFAATAALLLFAGLFVQPGNILRMLHHRRFETPVPKESALLDQRLGPVALPAGERAIWNQMAERFAGQDLHFNVSNYQLDYFLLGKQIPFPFVPLHLGIHPRDQALVVGALDAFRPDSIVWRSSYHPHYWGVAPYALMFHIIDAYVLSAYAYDGPIGPYQILRRAPCRGLRTYNDLLVPPARVDLRYGWAPYTFGLEGDRGIATLAPFLEAVPSARRWCCTATLKAGARTDAVLVIRAAGAAAVAAPVRIEFYVKQGEHQYVFPLWNLAAWGDGTPREWLRCDLEAPEDVAVITRGIVKVSEQ